jgi:hypothetical protein
MEEGKRWRAVGAVLQSGDKRELREGDEKICGHEE